jgi:hypothetical protein
LVDLTPTVTVAGLLEGSSWFGSGVLLASAAVVDEEVEVVEDSDVVPLEVDDSDATDDDVVVELEVPEVVDSEAVADVVPLEVDEPAPEVEETEAEPEAESVGFAPAPTGRFNVIPRSSRFCGDRFFIMRLRLTCSRLCRVASWASTTVAARQTATRQKSVVLDEANMSRDIVRKDV